MMFLFFTSRKLFCSKHKKHQKQSHVMTLARPHPALRTAGRRRLWWLPVAVVTLIVLIQRTGQAHAPSHHARLPFSELRAVTVLHTNCSTLAFTLANFAGNLGSRWPLAILHNDDLSEFVATTKLVSRMTADGRLHTASLERHGFDALPRNTTDGYSRLLTSPRFWQFVNADHVLIFQTDSVLCSLSPWRVDDFLEYDYVGAPWQVSYDGITVGNGGLSLRNAKTMLAITRQYPYTGDEHEDLYFSRALKNMQDGGRHIHLPTPTVARNFAYETGLPPTLASFGVHKMDMIVWRQATPLWRATTGDTRPTAMAKPVSPHAAAITATCPEATMGVLNSCRVAVYDEADVDLLDTFMAAPNYGQQSGGESVSRGGGRQSWRRRIVQ